MVAPRGARYLERPANQLSTNVRYAGGEEHILRKVCFLWSLQCRTRSNLSLRRTDNFPRVPRPSKPSLHPIHAFSIEPLACLEMTAIIDPPSVVTSWLPVTTAWSAPSICSSLILNSNINDPQYGISLDPSLRCLSPPATTWWEQDWSSNSLTTISLANYLPGGILDGHGECERHQHICCMLPNVSSVPHVCDSLFIH